MKRILNGLMVLTCAAALTLTGCPEDDPEPSKDVPSDPGTTPDPDVPADPGVQPDEGPEPDQGPQPDEGPQPDPGTGGDVLEIVGLCMNPDDLAVDRDTAEAAAKECGLGCLGAADKGACAVDCMLDPGGSHALALSDDCASCYAGSVVCAAENCLAGGECLAPDSQACSDCLAANCNPAFFACSGFESDCADNLDENGDGNTDCEDPSCAGDEDCP